MQIISHLLVSPNVTRVACPKNSTPLERPEVIVMHYTAGGDGRDSALYLADKATRASAHVVIARDGQVFQLVPFNVRAWHAGAGSLDGRTNVNAFSIGVELANSGRLVRRDDRWFAWYGQEIPRAEVHTARGADGVTYWHAYTPLQLRVAARVCRLLCERYGIRRLVGHSDITSRKQDPGPAFPWEAFRHAALVEDDGPVVPADAPVMGF